MKPILYARAGVTEGFERMNVMEQAKDGSWFKLSGVQECDVLGCWVMVECLDHEMGRPMTDNDGNVLYVKEYGTFKIEMIEDEYDAPANKDAASDSDYGPWGAYNPFAGGVMTPFKQPAKNDPAELMEHMKLFDQRKPDLNCFHDPHNFYKVWYETSYKAKAFGQKEKVLGPFQGTWADQMAQIKRNRKAFDHAIAYGSETCPFEGGDIYAQTADRLYRPKENLVPTFVGLDNIKIDNGPFDRTSYEVVLTDGTRFTSFCLESVIRIIEETVTKKDEIVKGVLNQLKSIAGKSK